MPKTTIVGLFDDERNAKNAEDGLKDRGIKRGQYQKLSRDDVFGDKKGRWGIGKEKKSEDPADDLIADLKARGVPDDDARDFAEAVRRGGNLLVTEVEDDSKVDEVVHYLDEQGAVDLDDRRRSWRGEGRESSRESGREIAGGEEAHLQEAREELKVGKRDTETGGVRVHKRVEEKPVEEDVTLREEHAEVEREKVDRPASSGEENFQEESFEVTEHSEEPVVEKKTHIEEEVRVGKESSERTETVRDTVRETHIDIEEVRAEVPEERRYSEYEPEYREHYTSSFGDKDGEYSEYEPAYRFGHTLGASDRYRGRDYDQLEPNIRKTYDNEYGEGSYGSHRDAVRHGFETARNRRRG